MTLSLYLNKLPMKTITFILSILFSATVFSQSLVEKSFPKEELFSLGSYYYPEQWDSSQWERDLKKMSDMGIKFTHFAEFSWSMMEPEEGRYNFEWLDRAVSLAEKYGLKVIYDAAHTFGVKYKGQGTGTFGDVSCFSFHATKVFHTIEGGAACFKDEELGRTLYRLKNFGIKNEEVVDGVGANAKMNEFQAAMGLCNLRHIDAEIQKRKAVVERYRERLNGVGGIQLNPVQEYVTSNYAYFPVIFHEKQFGFTRNEVHDRLAQENIFSRKYFYPLTNTYDCFHGAYDVSETPVALEISRRVLTLPLYADLPLEEVDHICDIILGMRN